MIYPQVKSDVVVPPGTPDKTLFVSVDKTFGKVIDAITKKTPSLEDCARGYWKDAHLAAAHGEDCDYLMARKCGRIVGIWKIDQSSGWTSASASPKKTWPSDKPNDCPRSACCLVPVDEEIETKFIGKEVHLGRNHNSLRGYFIDK